MMLLSACCAKEAQCRIRRGCARHIITGPNPKYIGSLQAYAMDSVRASGLVYCTRFDKNIPKRTPAA